MEFSWTETQRRFSRRLIASGNRKFLHGAGLGYNVTVVPPTRRIGIGAVVRPGSVVCMDVPDYAVVSGFPARRVGWRIPKDKIPALLQSRWWDRSPSRLGEILEVSQVTGVPSAPTAR